MTDIERSAVVVAITGGIACGKSEVGRIIGDLGFVVCDTDRIAHDLMAKGTPVFQRLVEHFGSQILTENGKISRPALGKIVFDDAERRLLLNSLVHPAVKDVLVRWIADRRARGENAAVQIPLLFESGMDALDWDSIVCVSCSDELVIERLEKRGITHQDAEKRIASQMPLAEKERRSDHVINNLGTMRELEEATQRAVECLLVER